MGQNESTTNEQISNISLFILNPNNTDLLAIINFTIEYLEKHKFKEHGYVVYSIH